MSKIPEHYIGKYKGIKVKDVCDDFELSYHLGSATKYICRAYHKHPTPETCIRKAIHHLQFELELLEKQQTKTVTYTYNADS